MKNIIKQIVTNFLSLPKGRVGVGLLLCICGMIPQVAHSFTIGEPVTSLKPGGKYVIKNKVTNDYLVQAKGKLSISSSTPDGTDESYLITIGSDGKLHYSSLPNVNDAGMSYEVDPDTGDDDILLAKPRRIAVSNTYFSLQQANGEYIIEWKGGVYGVSSANHDEAKWLAYKVTLPGDLNADGEVTIGDVAALIEILNGRAQDANGTADVNGDGSVNIEDLEQLKSDVLCLQTTSQFDISEIKTIEFKMSNSDDEFLVVYINRDSDNELQVYANCDIMWEGEYAPALVSPEDQYTVASISDDVLILNCGFKAGPGDVEFIIKLNLSNGDYRIKITGGEQYYSILDSFTYNETESIDNLNSNPSAFPDE